jgi:hypothetical protein
MGEEWERGDKNGEPCRAVLRSRGAETQAQYQSLLWLLSHERFEISGGGDH